MALKDCADYFQKVAFGVSMLITIIIVDATLSTPLRHQNAWLILCTCFFLCSCFVPSAMCQEARADRHKDLGCWSGLRAILFF